ncbi:DUF6414 family protein [Alteribacter populi]|uniref:DUF6414 family protein n=1 Tax=Alteribacter populi TaxID=2011011 RepID=UPI0018E32BB0|nr:hypothetical protein [Alteribacter populi]
MSIISRQSDLLEFMYLDMEFVNSISAQFFQGNILEMYLKEELGMGQEVVDQYGTNQTKKSGYSSGINLAVTGKHEGSEESGSHESKSLKEQETQNTSESMKIAINEYAYNNVVKKMRENDLIKTSKISEKYDYLETAKTFKYIDFKAHSNIYNFEKMIELVMYNHEHGFLPFDKIRDHINHAKGMVKKRAKKVKGTTIIPDENAAHSFLDQFNSMAIFETIEKLSNYMNDIFSDHFILLSEDNELVICKKQNLKVPSITLTLSGEVEVKVFGKVLNENTNEVEVEDINSLIKNDSSEELLSKGAGFFISIYLTYMYGLKPNKPFSLVHPMGIQFER